MKQISPLLKADGAIAQPTLMSEFFEDANIFNLLPCAAYVADTSGVIVKYNQKAVELWGRVPENGDKVDLYCKRVGDERELSEKISSPRSIAQTLPSENIEMFIDRPGSPRIIVKVSVAPIKNNEGIILGTINCMSEISDQKKAEKELAWKTRELQDYIENASIALHWVDGDGIIKWANKTELDMLGYAPEEYIGHHVSEFHVEQNRISDILKRLNGNETLSGYESELLCKDGSTKMVHISSNVFWHEGKFVHTRCFTIDISEQKKLYSALKESETRYRQLIDSLQTPLYVTDANGVITYYNDAATELWGRSPQIGNDQWCGSTKSFTLKGETIDPEEASVAQCLKERVKIKGEEFIIERQDGTRRFVVPYPTPLFDVKGMLMGVINVLVDITHSKNIEKALTASELQYRQLVHNLNVAVYTTDNQGRITLYNQAAAKLWGREPEIGKDLWCGSYKIFKTDGSELPLDTCPMALCLKEGRPIFGEEILVIRPDGSLRHVAPHPQPFFDESGKMIGAINMLVDVTDIKSTEKLLLESEAKYRELAATLQKIVANKTIDLQHKNLELKRSEERYHKMIEEVEDYAIILLDQDGIIQNWNKGAEKIKGYKEEEIVGKSFSNFYFTEDREAGLPFKLLGEAKHNGKAIHEGWRRRKDGSRFWGSIVLTSLHDDQNNVIGYSKVTRDLTERKLSEDRLREYTDQLEFQNKELEQFAYAASHDMKEPIRKIHLYNSFISENPSNVLDEQSREYLTRSINAVKRMSDLIEDLLTYSKTTANIHSLDKVDLNEVVEEIKLMHKEEFEQKKVQIKTENLPTINAIPFQIKQLMFNLINNSIKYKHAERDVSIEVRSQYISASEMNEAEAERDKDYQRISVIDNGQGFEPQHAEKIFKIFQRLTNNTSTEGSGIGLAICKKIVQNHRGLITATGKENEGARFDIYFPIDL